MNEQEMIAALTEILMNHETGPLSNLGSSIELDDEGMIVVETHSIHPFTDSIDVPQLGRELLLRLAGSRESLKPALLEAFASGHATRPEEFAELAASVVCGFPEGECSWCAGVAKPCHVVISGYYCTRELGHSGAHVACGNDAHELETLEDN